MKKLVYILSLLVLFLIFDVKVLAANEIVRCEYDVIYTPASANNPENKTYVKMIGYAYDDGTYKVYYDYQGTYKELEKGRNYKLDVSLYGFQGNHKMELSMGTEIYTDGFQLYNGSCPIAYSRFYSGTLSVSFGETSVCDNVESFCSEAKEIVSDKFKEDNEDKKITLTSTCTKSVVTEQFFGRDQGVEFTFNMYSDGSKEFCGRVRNANSFTCTEKTKKEEVMAIVMYDSNTLNGAKTFYIDKDEVGNVFKQNFQELEHNKFSCPSQMYLIYESVNQQMFRLTTSSSEASGWGDDAYEMKNGDLESNGDSDTTGGGHLTDPPGGGTGIGKYEGCSILGEGSELGEWLLSLLDIVKIGSLILIIILTFVDAIKKLSSFEENKDKKFYKNLMNRLICCALLFLIPSIIKLLLTIFSSNDIISDVLSEPFCGLL